MNCCYHHHVLALLRLVFTLFLPLSKLCTPPKTSAPSPYCAQSAQAQALLTSLLLLVVSFLSVTQ